MTLTIRIANGIQYNTTVDEHRCSPRCIFFELLSLRIFPLFRINCLQKEQNTLNGSGTIQTTKLFRNYLYISRDKDYFY